MYTCAPIVLFVYNRPDHTRKVIEGLRTNQEAEQSELFIFSDGPRQNASLEVRENILKVRKYIKSISGFKSINVEESVENRGLANSTIYGCSKIIQRYGRMIMIEDDDIPSRYFLSYVNEALERYEDDKRIWCVSGFTDTSILKPDSGDDLFCVNRPSSWGFGTWQRCWDKVIWDIETLKGIFSHKDIVVGFDKWAGSDSSRLMFNLFNGKNSSWSIRYNFTAYLNQALTILPNRTLIQNVGCDGTGTHCGQIEYKLEEMNRHIIFPDVIKFDERRNKALWNSFRPKIKDRIRDIARQNNLLKPFLKKSNAA